MTYTPKRELAQAGIRDLTESGFNPHQLVDYQVALFACWQMAMDEFLSNPDKPHAKESFVKLTTECMSAGTKFYKDGAALALLSREVCGTNEVVAFAAEYGNKVMEAVNGLDLGEYVVSEVADPIKWSNFQETYNFLPSSGEEYIVISVRQWRERFDLLRDSICEAVSVSIADFEMKIESNRAAGIPAIDPDKTIEQIKEKLNNENHAE